MEYFTLLTADTLGGTPAMYTTIWFPKDACWDILLNIGGFYDQINATEGHCDVSEVASRIVKPKLRPCRRTANG